MFCTVCGAKLRLHNVPKLLIIDDEPGVRKSIAMIASTDGWETFACDQFADVDAMLRDNAIDVLVCDYRMPPITGIRIIRQIRAGGFGFPIIMITASPDKIDNCTARDLVIRDILRKPPNVADVRRVLAAAAAAVGAGA